MERPTFATWLRETLCGFQGHDNLPQFGRARMYLKCTSCGHESPGWEIAHRAPAPRTNSATSNRPALVMVSPRRAA